MHASHQKQKVLDVGKRLICSHQVSCHFPTLFLSPTFFFVHICTHTTLKPGSRNSLGQLFPPYLSQFLVQHLLLLPQNRKIFLLAQVTWPLVHTPWSRQPFPSGPLNTHVSHFQTSEDTLCWPELCLFIPSNSSSSTTDSTSLPSGAMSNPTSPSPLHQQCHLEQLLLPQRLLQGFFSSLLSRSPTLSILIDIPPYGLFHCSIYSKLAMRQGGGWS